MEKKKKEKVAHSRVRRLRRLAEDVEQRLQNFSHGRLDARITRLNLARARCNAIRMNRR